MTDYFILGTILGSIFQVVICVGGISGCVFLCCWCQKRCRKRGEQNVVSVVYLPPPDPSGQYQTSNPNYQPVPVSPPNSGLPMPTAPPPSYQEATNYGHFPGYPVPLQPDQNMQQPFNPEYCPPKYHHT